MSKRFSVVVAAILLSMAIPLHGQTIVVGDVPATSNFTTAPKDTPLTVIDFSHPANEDGTITSVVIRWTGGSTACTNAFTIRIFRVTGLLDSMDLVAERGPFAIPAGGGLLTIELAPPVAVQKDDVIGVSEATGCGGVAGAYGDARDLQVVVSSDYSGGPLADAQLNRGYRVALRASSAPASLAGIIPVASATAGGFGASFHTTMQVTNVSAEVITSTFAYHPAGQMGNPNDPAVSVSLAPNATTTIELLDVLHLTGAGSVDVLTTGAPPLVTARVYNDTGSGTNGFTESMMPASTALRSPQRANIVLPGDLVNFRMNIGVRTLDNGATISGTVWDASGNRVGTITKIYPRNYFEQVTVQSFLGAVPASERATIDFQVAAGDAFVYSSTIDNRTNDSAIYFAHYR